MGPVSRRPGLLGRPIRGRAPSALSHFGVWFTVRRWGMDGAGGSFLRGGGRRWGRCWRRSWTGSPAPGEGPRRLRPGRRPLLSSPPIGSAPSTGSCPTGIPDKGRVLTGLSAFWFGRLESAATTCSRPTSTTPGSTSAGRAARPWPGRSMIVRKAEVVPFECVVRGYLVGERLAGVPASGHRLRRAAARRAWSRATASRPDLHPRHQGRVGPRRERLVRRDGRGRRRRTWPTLLRRLSLRHLRRGRRVRRSRKGLILADTKFEWGRDPETGELLLIDEVLTPDSSRYWPSADVQAGRPAAVVRQAVRPRLARRHRLGQGQPAAAPARRRRRADPREVHPGVRDPDRPAVPLEVTDHAPLPDRRRVARPGPDGHRRGVPLGHHPRHRGHQPRAEAPTGRLRPGQAADAGDRPGHRRVGDLPRRDHRRADHAPAGQQRRQARTAAGAGRPARRSHRPGRLDQLPDRASVRSSNAPAPARPPLRVAVGALAKLLLRELGIEVFGYVRELGGIDGPAAIASTRPSATPARSTR